MRNFDPDSLRALQDLDALGAPEQPLSAGELDRLSAAEFEFYRKRYSPYGTLASLYLWRIKDGGIPGGGGK